ncbi:MAG: M28 family peptidase [Bacteroidota bacterium]
MRTQILILLGYLLTSGSLLAQTPAERFAQEVDAKDLKGHLYFLADDMLEGRATGERGQKLAAHYISSTFRRLGLPGGMSNGDYYQTYYLNRTRLKSTSMKIGKKSFQFKDDFAPSLQGGIPESLDGEFVFAGFGMEEDLAGKDLKGKNVIIFSGDYDNPTPKGNLMAQFRSWLSRSKAIREAGAKSLFLVLTRDAYKIIGRNARRSALRVGDEPADGMALFYMSPDAGDYLLAPSKRSVEEMRAELGSSGNTPEVSLRKLKFEFSAKVEKESKAAENVLAFLEGTDKKDEVIVLTAHYDHIGITNDLVNNGADDDGSGTSTILELADAFTAAAKSGYRPRRSILFMTVSGEEIGLLGSAFYTDNPAYPIANTVANLNIDMIGRIDKRYETTRDSANYVYVIGSDKLSTELHDISENANKDYTNLVLDYKYNDPNDPNRFYYRSDHYNFAEKGVPIIFYFTGVHDDYHKPTDDPNKINFDKMAKIGRLVFHTAWQLANQEKRIEVDVKN